MTGRAEPSLSARRWMYRASDGGTYGPVEAADRETAERIAAVRCESAYVRLVEVVEETVAP